MSLDGYIAPEGMDMAHAHDPSYRDWLARWMDLQSWVFHQESFRKNLQLGEGGETGDDDRLLRRTLERTGVSIMGKRMFDGGEKFWPEEAPFHTPVYVVTHTKRDPWPRPGGTTFHFVNDGIESALRQALADAGGRDIRIAGGGDIIQRYLRAGLVDEFDIALAPVMLGGGVRLLEGIDPAVCKLERIAAPASPHVTHLHYRVKRETGGPAGEGPRPPPA